MKRAGVELALLPLLPRADLEAKEKARNELALKTTMTIMMKMRSIKGKSIITLCSAVDIVVTVQFLPDDKKLISGKLYYRQRVERGRVQPENLRLSLAFEHSLLAGALDGANENETRAPAAASADDWQASYFNLARAVLSLPRPPPEANNPSAVFAASFRAAAESLVMGESLLGRVVVEDSEEQDRLEEQEGQEEE